MLKNIGTDAEGSSIVRDINLFKYLCQNMFDLFDYKVGAIKPNSLTASHRQIIW